MVAARLALCVRMGRLVAAVAMIVAVLVEKESRTVVFQR